MHSRSHRDLLLRIFLPLVTEQGLLPSHSFIRDKHTAPVSFLGCEWYPRHGRPTNQLNTRLIIILTYLPPTVTSVFRVAGNQAPYQRSTSCVIAPHCKILLALFIRHVVSPSFSEQGGPIMRAPAPGFNAVRIYVPWCLRCFLSSSALCFVFRVLLMEEFGAHGRPRPLPMR